MSGRYGQIALDDSKFGYGGGSTKDGVVEQKVSKSQATQKIQSAKKEQLYAALKNSSTDPAIKKMIEKELDDRANRGV